MVLVRLVLVVLAAVVTVHLLQAILQALPVLRGKVMPEVLARAAPQTLTYSVVAVVAALAREALAALVLAHREGRVWLLQSRALRSHALAAVEAVSGLLAPLRVRVAQGAAAMAERMLMALRAPLIRAVAVAAAVLALQISYAQVVQAALAWSLFPCQQPTTLVQQQEAQRSPPAAQTQSSSLIRLGVIQHDQH